MMNKEAIAKALVEELTPMELAMGIIEAEEQRQMCQQDNNRLSHENMFLREWCDYMKTLVADMVHGRKGGEE
jgi:hypothetical protein